MDSITGTMRLGEAAKACGKIGRRQRGSVWFYYLVMVVLGLIGGAIGYVADQYFPAPWDIPYWMIGLWLGVIAYSILARKVLLWRFRRRSVSKGIAVDMPARLECDATALVYEIAGVYHRAPWSSVSELFAAKGYWIFLVAAGPWVIPRRWFANEAAERAFLREALSYMSEEARARSPEAVKFAQGVS